MRKFACMVMLLVTGCKDIAPPITTGKCVIDHFEGRTATKQLCKYDSQSYNCTDKNCDRLPEQALERPPTTPVIAK